MKQPGDYSQQGEQQIILDHFAGTTGRWLDIGAHNGRDNSNTLALAERGWGGVAVEPCPYVFPHLLDTHRGRDVVCVNAAIDEITRVTKWYSTHGDQISTTEMDHRRRWERDGYKCKDVYYIQTLTFESLLAALPGPYRFVNIDVEGANLRVLKACPLIEIGCELVCVEMHPGNEMVEYLMTIGYDQIKRTDGNWLASRRSS